LRKRPLRQCRYDGGVNRRRLLGHWCAWLWLPTGEGSQEDNRGGKSGGPMLSIGGLEPPSTSATCRVSRGKAAVIHRRSASVSCSTGPSTFLRSLGVILGRQPAQGNEDLSGHLELGASADLVAVLERQAREDQVGKD
jgi:hypothetical protein